MYQIKTFNSLAEKGLSRFSKENYAIGAEIENPEGILLRSQNLHDMAIPSSLIAIGRAGAGVNNIPVDAMSERGIAVFNTPGANANAVKELVVTGMLLAARNVYAGINYTQNLTGDDKALNKTVEANKKHFKGYELPGRTLAVIGLGAIGVKVANIAISLGMRVIGYDPALSIEHAWALSAQVERADSPEDALKQANFATVHIPMNDKTRHFINKERINFMPKGCVLLNFARAEIIDNAAVKAALESEELSQLCHRFSQ